MNVRELAPSACLAPYVRSFAVVETGEEVTRLLVPEPSLLLGFRYSGSATQLEGLNERRHPAATVAGFHASARRMRTSAGGGTVIVKFRETGAARFFSEPLNLLFDQTRALEDLIPRREISLVTEQVSEATTDRARVAAIERFLHARLRSREPDRIVAAAVDAIRASAGAVRIGALAKSLFLSQDALEKRFRAAVGATPKQLGTLLRLRQVVYAAKRGGSLSRLALEAGYADQSHFIRNFRAAFGEAPGHFLKAGNFW